MDTETFSVWQQIGAALAALSVGFYFGLRKLIPMIQKRRAVRKDELFEQINRRVWEVLSELRMKTKSSRVSLIQFHNGGKFADGTSMRRMSASHQVCDTKISSTMQFRQDVLVSRYVEIMQFLQDNDPHIHNVQNMFESNSKKFYEMHDTLYFAILPIFCSDSMLVYGYITLEWCSFENIENVDEKDVAALFDASRKQVSYLINSTKDYR